jgi:hypothetical protein
MMLRDGGRREMIACRQVNSSIITVYRMSAMRPFWAVFFICLLVRMPLPGQQIPPGQRLRIIALEGNGAINHIPTQTVTVPIIEVRDENDRPVEGARVVFTAPASGPGATFQGGQNTYTGVTDFRGQLAAAGYTINDRPGRFLIRISALYEDRTGQLTISQTNSMDQLPPEIGGTKRSGKLKWILLGVAAGAGAGLGVYFGTRSSTTPITVGTGPVVIGGPR